MKLCFYSLEELKVQDLHVPRTWHSFSVKGQGVNILSLWAAQSLLDLLNSAVLVQKHPQKIGKLMAVDVLQ